MGTNSNITELVTVFEIPVVLLSTLQSKECNFPSIFQSTRGESPLIMSGYNDVLRPLDNLLYCFKQTIGDLLDWKWLSIPHKLPHIPWWISTSRIIYLCTLLNIYLPNSKNALSPTLNPAYGRSVFPGPKY